MHELSSVSFEAKSQLAILAILSNCLLPPLGQTYGQYILEFSSQKYSLHSLLVQKKIAKYH